MRDKIQILILEDSVTQMELICEFLHEKGYSMPILTAKDKKSYIKELNENKPDVIICDHILPSFNSFEAFKIAKNKFPNVVFIVVSENITDEFGIELLKIGIDDYFMKNNLFRLPFVIESEYTKYYHIEKSNKTELINKELECANKLIEEKNNSIIQSIIFAERIQALTLPKIDLLLKNFSEAFIIYKPKDIVSGDFYWFFYVGDWVIITVADCTGHGVSGALLAMLGINLLNEIIITEKNYSNLSSILTKLDVNICKSLKQKLNNGGYQDGIDLGLVSINKKENKLYFCGSKRSLLHLIKNQKEIVSYSGNPYLVGGNCPIINKNFITQEIKYDFGDTIYMFTDGYVDQFGGEDDKKLTKKYLIELLLSFQHLSLEHQSQLLEEKLVEWQGNGIQTDDILMVGVKL
jgi:serine phosphatase RsbU (regulator of sigma subunit)